MAIKTRFVIAGLLTVLALAGAGVNAGGTPPDLAWETTIDASPIGCTSTATSVASLALDSSGNIYVLCGAQAPTKATIKYATNGNKVWQTQITCTPPVTCGNSIGIATDSAGHVVHDYCDSTSTHRIAFHDANDGDILFTLGATAGCGTGGTEPVAHFVDTLTLNATSIQYVTGDSARQISYICHWNLETSPCVEAWEVASLDRGPIFVSSGGPYIQAFVSTDPSISGGGSLTWRTNLANGGVQTSTGTQTACEGNGSPWYDTLGTSVYQLYIKDCLTLARPGYRILPVSTFSEGAATGFTEDMPVLVGEDAFTQWAPVAGTAFLDGENRAFFCGRVITAAGEDWSTIMKFNLGTNAQVWNITYNKLAPDSAGAERVDGCQIDKDGALIVLGWSCTTGSSSGCTHYLRKYLAAGTPRTAQTKIIPATPEVIAPANPIQDSVNFVAESWGISETASGWLFGLAIVGMVVFRVKNGHPILILILAIIAIGLAVQLELFPVWLLLVIVFGIIAFAGSALFTKSEGSEE